MTSITIRVDDKRVRAALGRLAATGADLHPTLDEIGAAMLTSTQTRFETETAPSGQRWKPLAKSTIDARKRQGAAVFTILRLSARLYSSLTFAVGDDEVEIGTNLAYAPPHQFGATIHHYARSQQASFRYADEGAYTKKDGSRVGSKLRFASKRARGTDIFTKPITIGEHAVTIPARPYLGLSDDDVKTITEIAERHLATAIDGPAAGGDA